MDVVGCLKSPYVQCFKVPFINMLSNIRQPINIRHGFSYVIKSNNKGGIQ